MVPTLASLLFRFGIHGANGWLFVIAVILVLLVIYFMTSQTKK